MAIKEICRSYFHAYYDSGFFRHYDAKTNAANLLIFLSYFSLVIPAGFIALYLLSSLYGRIFEKEELSPIDMAINEYAAKILHVGSRVLQCIKLSDILGLYSSHYKPQRNEWNLQQYSQSDDFQRHAKTACVYYNADQMANEDALRVVFQREPTNIAMGANQYPKDRLKALFGYERGAYCDPGVRKEDGSKFNDLPNTAAVYSETYLWSPPGSQCKKEVACLSLPAPALDDPEQPHYSYYMGSGMLNVRKYEREMEFLFKCVEKAAVEHKTTAFGNKGIKRILLSKFGQGAFLDALSGSDRIKANTVYRRQLQVFLKRMEKHGLEIVMVEYKDPGAKRWHDKIIVGDILENAHENDLIINAWDPHSAPGNGNDHDHSFDGRMGMGTGIILTQTSWLNKHLRVPACLRPIQKTLLDKLFGL